MDNTANSIDILKPVAISYEKVNNASTGESKDDFTLLLQAADSGDSAGKDTKLLSEPVNNISTDSAEQYSHFIEDTLSAALKGKVDEKRLNLIIDAAKNASEDIKASLPDEAYLSLMQLAGGSVISIPVSLPPEQIEGLNSIIGEQSDISFLSVDDFLAAYIRSETSDINIGTYAEDKSSLLEIKKFNTTSAENNTNSYEYATIPSLADRLTGKNAASDQKPLFNENNGKHPNYIANFTTGGQDEAVIDEIMPTFDKHQKTQTASILTSKLTMDGDVPYAAFEGKSDGSRQRQSGDGQLADILPNGAARDGLVAVQDNSIEAVNLKPKRTDTALYTDKLSDKSVINQLIKNGNFRLNKDRSEILVDLDPPHLGSVHIKISIDSKKNVNAMMVAETQTAKDIIEGNLSHLKDSLYAQGIVIDRFSVSISNSGNFNQNSHRAENYIEYRDGKASSAQISDEADGKLIKDVRSVDYAGKTGNIDLFI